MKLICVFVFAYAKSRFSHNEAQIWWFSIKATMWVLFRIAWLNSFMAQWSDSNELIQLGLLWGTDKKAIAVFVKYITTFFYKHLLLQIYYRSTSL